MRKKCSNCGYTFYSRVDLDNHKHHTHVFSIVVIVCSLLLISVKWEVLYLSKLEESTLPVVVLVLGGCGGDWLDLVVTGGDWLDLLLVLITSLSMEGRGVSSTIGLGNKKYFLCLEMFSRTCYFSQGSLLTLS